MEKETVKISAKIRMILMMVISVLGLIFFMTTHPDEYLWSVFSGIAIVISTLDWVLYKKMGTIGSIPSTLILVVMMAIYLCQSLSLPTVNYTSALITGVMIVALAVDATIRERKQLVGR